MYDGPVGFAVRNELESLANRSRLATASETDVLRQRVCAAVDELKTMGWPIERIIIRLKEVAAEVGLHPTRQAISGPHAIHRDSIIADAVRWTIDRYYGGPSAE